MGGKVAEFDILEKPTWIGYHDNSYSWTATVGGFADPTTSATGSLVQTRNTSFGTVTPYNNAGTGIGITFTPNKVGAVYEIIVKTNYYITTSTGGGAAYARLWDGTTVIDDVPKSVGASPVNTQGGNLGGEFVLSGTYVSTGVTPVTISAQIYNAANGITISGGGGNASVTWEIRQRV